jgi:arylsulfatase A-like enzyme
LVPDSPGGWSCLLPALAASAAERPRNVVIILADDLGWRDLGCQGSTWFRTPNIGHLAADAERFIAANAQRPFPLHYWASSVHDPLGADAGRLKAWQERPAPATGQRSPLMGAMVEEPDTAVGRIYAALEKAGVLDRTIIIFTSDNGPVLYSIPARQCASPQDKSVPSGWNGMGVSGAQAPDSKGRSTTEPQNDLAAAEARYLKTDDGIPVSDVAPLRGGKAMLWEGGVRVPFLCRWPGVVRPGTVSDRCWSAARRCASASTGISRTMSRPP